MRREFPQLFLGLLFLAVAFVLGSAYVASTIRDARRADDAIVVTGSAKRAITSDVAVLRFSVSNTQEDIADAYANVQRYAAATDAFLRTQGLGARELTRLPTDTEPVTFTETTENGREVQRGAYRLTRRYEVQSRDVDRVVRVSQGLGELIRQGVPVVASGIEYLYTKLPDVRVELLAEATKDARVRAQAIAQSTGASVGAVRHVSVGVFQITPRNSVQVDDYGSFDTSSREKDVTAVTRVTFAIR